MARARLAFSVAAVLLFAACDLGPTGPTSDDVSISSRSTNRACPSDLKVLAAAGQPCTVSGDCSELCCTCSTGTAAFAAQVCINQVCQSSSTACPKAEDNAPERCPVP